MLLNRQILGKVRSFPDIDFTTVGMKRYHEDLPKKPKASWFKPGCGRPVLPLHHATSLSDTASWTSYSASSLLERWVRSFWFARRSGGYVFWVASADAWVSSLVGQGLIFRRASSGVSGPWYLSCGSLNNLVVVGFRLVRYSMGGPLGCHLQPWTTVA